MITFDIRLTKMDDVRRFVAITSASPVDVGIFSLDLSKPVNVQIHSDARKADAEALAEALKVFVC